ncbi:MAG TPA: ABC transporter permease [bacterium]|nr:ABC transporter permease [bacterium]
MLEGKSLTGSAVNARPAAPARSRRKRAAAALRARVISTTAVVMFLAAWEGVVRFGLINPLFTSSPSRIVMTFLRMLHEGVLAKDIRVSGTEFLIGYSAAILVGVLVGVAMGWYRDVSAALQPFVSALYSTPRIALLPLFIIWLGIGIWSKVAVVFLVAMFQILINAEAGVRAADESLIRTARSFGANDWQIFTTIVVPGAVPFLIAGLRLGLGQALVGIVVGELYAATAGIGYEIAVAGETFQTDRVFVGIAILALAAIFLMWCLRRVELRFERWKPQRAA